MDRPQSDSGKNEAWGCRRLFFHPLQTPDRRENTYGQYEGFVRVFSVVEVPEIDGNARRVNISEGQEPPLCDG